MAYKKMPSSSILKYGLYLKEKYPKIWRSGGNIFGNDAFKNLIRVEKRGYWLDSEEWMYKKWQSFIARHQHDYRLAGVVANIKWAAWGNIGEKKAKKVIEEYIKKWYKNR